jgi:tetratricopeptide (TPR) repeat protein
MPAVAFDVVFAGWDSADSDQGVRMTMNPIATYLLGAAAMLAAALLLVPVQSAVFRPGLARRGVAALIIGLPALLMLFAAGNGNDSNEGRRAEPASLATLPAPAPGGATKEAADWAMITHAFLGGPPPRPAATQSTPGNATQRAQLGADELEAVTRREPGNVDAWLALAQARRVAREFPQAAAAYEAALKIDARNADAWADYADALASTNGRRLAGKPATAIEHALRLEPNHLKGLWLAASLDLEERRFSAALARWQQLRAALPAGSPDASIIDANIAEARQLAEGMAQSAPPG